MRKFSILLYTAIIICTTAAPKNLIGQFNLRFRPYAGVGMSLAQDPEVPSIIIEDEFDQEYFNYNLADVKKFYLRGHTRVNIFDINKVSLGYMFWGHNYKYRDDPFNNFVKLNAIYPQSYQFSLHLATIQWNLNYSSIARKFFVPFILGGYGKYWGNENEYHNDWKDETEALGVRIVTKAKNFEGWGFAAGGGAVIFKYFFVYIGYVNLMDSDLPVNQFFDFVIGVTI